MKYMVQFMLLCGLAFLGEIIKYFLNIPIPGNIIGMLILFFLLCIKVVKPQQIAATCDFLLEIMPLMFVPVAVGLMTAYQYIQNDLVAVLVTVFGSTIVVLGVTGWTTQLLERAKNKRGEKKHHE